MYHGFHRDPKFPHPRLQGAVVSCREVDSQLNAVECALCPAATEERVEKYAIHFGPVMGGERSATSKTSTARGRGAYGTVHGTQNHIVGGHSCDASKARFACACARGERGRGSGRRPRNHGQGRNSCFKNREVRPWPVQCLLPIEWTQQRRAFER